MQLTLDHTTKVAENIHTFWCKPSHGLRYTAGQFVELTLDHPNPDSRGTRRWFTLSSSPTEELLAITTKYDTLKSSSFKQSLFALKPGNTVISSQPMGDFVLPKDPATPIVFIAGGIGITPIRSMVKWLVDTGQQRPIQLLYALNSLQELAFGDLLSSYELQQTIVPSTPPKDWTGPSGRLNAQTIMQTYPSTNPSTLYYISGPEQMVESLGQQLQQNGIDKHQIVGDYFPNYSGI